VINTLLINTVSTEPIESLETDPEIALTVLTHPEYAHHYRAETPLVPVSDVTDLRQVRDAAVGILRSRPIDRIVAPSERGLQPAGYLRSFLGLPGTGYDVANLFSNKYAMKRALAAAGLPVAPFAALGGLDDLPRRAAGLGWPVVVKPVIGAAARHTHVLTGEHDFAELLTGPYAAGLRDCPYPFILERFVDVEAEFHCDGVVVDGAVRYLSLSQYLMPPLVRRGHVAGSYTLAADNPERAPLVELHAAAVTALGLRDGVTHLEVLRTRDGYLVGEISTRPGAGGTGDLVRLSDGVDLWQALIDVSVGREPACTPNGTGDVVVACMLPARPGRVEQVTPAAELAALPGVVDVQKLVQPGGIVSDELSSSIYAGLVFLRAPDEATVPAMVAAVERAFSLSVTPALEAA
jgi:biotin carboxylase